MTDTKKPKYEKLMTPLGEAKWAHVHKPKDGYEDPRTGKKGEPKYQIDVYFDPADPLWKPWVDALMKQFAALPQQKDKEGDPIKKQKPLKREMSNDDPPKATGRLFASFKTGVDYPPAVFDKYGQPILPNVLVGNGSKVRVSYSPSTYEGFGGGINFYLNAVQVVELVEYKAKTADAYGFPVDKAPEGEEPPTQGPADDNIPF